jgi:hypothetical protein
LKGDQLQQARGADAVVGGAGEPAAYHDAVAQQRIAAQLPGVLYRSRQVAPVRCGDRVAGQGSGRVHLPQTGTAHAEQPVELALLIGQEQTRPAEVVRERGEGGRWAEPTGDEAGRAAGSELTHPHEVLLAGQSKPVPDRGEQVTARQRAEIHGVPGARIGQYEAVQ